MAERTKATVLKTVGRGLGEGAARFGYILLLEGKGAGMAEALMLVCDRCGRPAVESISFRASSRSLKGSETPVARHGRLSTMRRCSSRSCT